MHSSKLKKIKYLLFDLHGVILSSEAESPDEASLEYIMSKLRDDIITADKLNIRLGVISATEDQSLINKIKETGIKEVLSHSIDKVSQAEKLLKTHNLSYEEIGYIGDDILDLPLLARAGFSATTRQARREVKRAVNYIVRNENSNTVLSELLQLIAKAQQFGKLH